MKNFPQKAQIYFRIVVSIGILMLIYLTINLNINLAILKGLIFFSILSVITDTIQVPMPKGGYVTVTTAVTYACLLLFGPEVASYVSIQGLFFSKFLTKEEKWYKVIFNCAQFTISIGVAGIVYKLAGGQYWNIDLYNIIPLILAAITYYFFNTTAVALILAFVNNVSPWVIWVFNIKWSLPNMLTLSPVGLLMAVTYRHYGPIAVSLFFIPLLLARYVFKSYMEMREVYLNTLAALVDALDAKDAYTRGHSDRVSTYATEIAREMKLPEDQIEVIQHMGLLHDVGKIGVDDEILSKPGRLENHEFDQIKKHSEIGARIVNEISDLGQAKDFILYHHEKYNGTGYPTGLHGRHIPLGARIITVADCFDAMTSDRPYRKGMSISEAVLELKMCSDSHFDPKIVEAFIRVLEREKTPAPLMAGETKEA